MLKTPFLKTVAESPLFKPFKPKPLFLMISLVTVNVEGHSLTRFRFDWSCTLITSKGFTRTPSVTPAKNPASEKV